VTLVAVALLPLPAHATEVDYDAVDEAALPMVAQTSLPQAADQFCRAYRQLLIYDHEEYENEYNYDNLEGSLVASSVVLYYDEAYEDDLRWCAGEAGGLALYWMGYCEDSAKLTGLCGAFSALGNAVSRWWHAEKTFGKYFWECLGSALDPAGRGAFLLSGAGGAAAIRAGSALAGATAFGLYCLYLGLGVCAVCILVGGTAYGSALYYGEYFE